MSPAIRLIVCALLATVTPSLRAATIEATTPESMQQALILRVDGELTIDPQGVPTDYQIKTELPQKLRDSLQQHVHSWRFEPVLVGGKPALAHTQMHVTLAAQGDGRDFRVTIDSVTFPQKHGQLPDGANEADAPAAISYAKKPAIQYPLGAAQYGLEANVVVELLLTRDGHVHQAAIEQTALFDVKGKPELLAEAAHLFEQAVLAGVKSWRFNVASRRADLSNADLTVRVPVSFSVPDSGHHHSNASWEQIVRTTPPRRAPWLPTDPHDQPAGVAEFADGQLAPAVQRRFRLSAPVVGSVL